MNSKNNNSQSARFLCGLLRFMVGILLLAASAGCSVELPEPDQQEEWIPVKIATSVNAFTVTSSDTRAATRAIPSIVKTEFVEGDELKLTIYKADGVTVVKTVTIVRHDYFDPYSGHSSEWMERKNGSLVVFNLPRSYDGYKIIAEYGTKMADGTLYAETNYMKTDVENLRFDRTEFYCGFTLSHQYPCIEVNLITDTDNYTGLNFMDSDKSIIQPFLPFDGKHFGPYFVDIAGSAITGVSLKKADASADTFNSILNPAQTIGLNYYLFTIKVP